MQFILEEIGSRSNRETYANIKQLSEHPGWTEDLLPSIRKMIEHHTDQATNPDLPAEKRAEHIEAIHTLKSFAEYPARRMAQLNAQWKTKPTPQA